MSVGTTPTAVWVIRTISCCTDCGSTFLGPKRNSAPVARPTIATTATETMLTILATLRFGAGGGAP